MFHSILISELKYCFGSRYFVFCSLQGKTKKRTKMTLKRVVFKAIVLGSLPCLSRCYTLKLLAETGECATALRNKFQEALHRVTWSVS